MKKPITIYTLPQKQQRYPTIGDWQEGPACDYVAVTELPDTDMEFLIAVHELVEMYLCQKAGITQDTVDAWDYTFVGPGEPGDHPDAPYQLQHQAAESIERHLAQILGVDWNLYQREVDRALESK